MYIFHFGDFLRLLCIYFILALRMLSHSSLQFLFLNMYIWGSPCHSSLKVYSRNKLLTTYSHTSPSSVLCSLYIYIYIKLRAFHLAFWWTQWTLFLQSILDYIQSLQHRICVVTWKFCSIHFCFAGSTEQSALILTILWLQHHQTSLHFVLVWFF